jgi:3-oxoacyl-[acyl-carrier-protein] synthase III
VHTLRSTKGPAATGILGLGHYRPANVVTNDDLVARGVDTNDEWIKSRVGIAERRWADPDETVVDMAEQAASKALAASGVPVDQVDLVLVATCTMPTPIPAAAPHLATRLGIAAPGAYDISSGCSGFVYGINAASAAVLSGQARNVLLVASERFSGWLDMADRSTCVILGDGAGAAVIGAADATGLGPVVWGSDGAMYDSVAIDEQSRYFRQEGQTVYRWATTQLPPIAREVCTRAGITPEELAGVVLHQANLRIIEPVARKLGATNAVIARDVVDSGNTSAASVPLALSKLVERREIAPGSPVLLFGFGGNLSYAGQVIRCP